MKRIRIIECIFLGEIILLTVFILMREEPFFLYLTSYLLLMIAVICVIGIESKFVKKMNKLKEVLNSSDSKDLDNLLSQDIFKNPYMDEIKDIMEKYAVVKIHQNNTEIFDKHTELTALQSQINPHFLYNTLDTIRGQAMLDDNIEVAQMIETLASFFRYSISRKGNMVTLRDELDNINNYMSIQQYRFNNRFSLEIIVDKEDAIVYDYDVPRLILQPIVENAIIHGLAEKTQDAKITIEITVADDLIITVSDNGKGMSLSELDELNHRIHSKEIQLRKENIGQDKGTGIALPNISKRLSLLYGAEYGLNIYSSVGCGTDVEIVIPITKGRGKQ